MEEAVELDEEGVWLVSMTGVVQQEQHQPTTATIEGAPPVDHNDDDCATSPRSTIIKNHHPQQHEYESQPQDVPCSSRSSIIALLQIPTLDDDDEKEDLTVTSCSNNDNATSSTSTTTTLHQHRKDEVDGDDRTDEKEDATVQQARQEQARTEKEQHQHRRYPGLPQLQARHPQFFQWGWRDGNPRPCLLRILKYAPDEEETKQESWE